MSLAKIVESLEVGERYVADGLPDDIYHEAPGIGSSAIKQAAISMAHYKAYCERERDVSPQAAKNMRIGSATHCLVLEPDTYEEKFVTQPRDIKQRRGEKWEQFKEDNPGKTILAPDEPELASDMANAVLDSQLYKYFEDGKAEQSIWYRHESGLLLKCRLDYHRGDLGVDLKTTIRDSPKAFANCVKYEYDMQDAHYRMVADIKDFAFVGILKTKPHCAFLTKQGSDVRRLAEQRLNKAIEELRLAQDFDDYPGVPVELIETSLNERELAQLEV